MTDMVIATNIWGQYCIPKSIYYTYTAQLILQGGVHEDTTIDYIKSVGGNIIHSGAGFGDFLPALNNCDSIWTFEPNPLMYDCCNKTIELNGISNVNLSPLALGDYNGTSFLKCQDTSGLEMGPRSEISNRGIQVGMTTLDSVIPEDIKISLIHLDLEGYEFKALLGAKEIIKRDRPIIILEIDSRAVDYNNFMNNIDYTPHKQLIFNSNEKMVFVNTVYFPKESIPGKNYWSSELPLPLSPSDRDVEIFQNNLISGTTLMLGCTKKLIPISSNQLDINPWYDAETVIVGNWIYNQRYYDNIIIDGGLCFSKELADSILEMASKNCKKFIARTFTKKLPIMRVADYFPKEIDFKIKPQKTIDFTDYSFYIWEF